MNVSGGGREGGRLGGGDVEGGAPLFSFAPAKDVIQPPSPAERPKRGSSSRTLLILLVFFDAKILFQDASVPEPSFSWLIRAPRVGTGAGRRLRLWRCSHIPAAYPTILTTEPQNHRK